MISLKVSYNDDVRKITSNPEGLFAAIVERYGLDLLSGQSIELWYQDCVVDLDMLVAVASTLEPGKPLKVVMTLTDVPPSEPEPEVATMHPGIWCDTCGTNPIIGARYWKQLEGDTYDLCQGCFDKLDSEKQKELTLKTDPSSPWGDIADPSPDSNTNLCAAANTTADVSEQEQDPKKLRQMAQDAKLKASATKMEAQKLASCAKQEAKLAKSAAAAAKKAEKAYMKAEALAKKQAHKAAALAKKQAKQQEKQAKKETKAAGIEVTHGKLVNWCDKDCPASFGELIALPCGRLCFHVDSHPGNLRVNDEFEVQKNGGRGTFAQFEAVPSDDKPSVFRLLSHQHRECGGCYLGVDPSENSNAPLFTASGTLYEFSLVPDDSTHGLWSFYPDGHHTPIEISAPAPLPGAREVYRSMQQFIEHLAASTQIPISMGDAPEDETQLVEMLNLLHDELPHGLKRIAMKKIGLREFEIRVEEPEDAPFPEEWDLMLQDLHEMGFESAEQNLMAVQNSGGNLKQAVKQLRMQELDTHGK